MRVIRVVAIWINRIGESDNLFDIRGRMRLGKSIGSEEGRKVSSRKWWRNRKVNGAMEGAAVSAVLELYYSFDAPGGFNAKRIKRQLPAGSCLCQ